MHAQAADANPTAFLSQAAIAAAAAELQAAQAADAGADPSGAPLLGPTASGPAARASMDVAAGGGGAAPPQDGQAAWEGPGGPLLTQVSMLQLLLLNYMVVVEGRAMPT